jgi:SAM-dependent methyltransferase
VTDELLSFATQLRTGNATVWPKEVVDLLGARGDDSGGDQSGIVEAMVTALAELAGRGPVLELAVGSGRIALPLARRGIRVDGIDNSTAMVDKMRERPGGDEISVTIGDFSDVGVDGTYSMVYLVANSLECLTTQEKQIRCFENVAAHLTDDGLFVVESSLPAWLDGLQRNQYVRTEALDVNYVALDTARHDPVRQSLERVVVILTNDHVRLIPVVFRYVWPSEMDLMARLAGLQLKERWGGWNREPVTPVMGSNCISVYGR